MTPIGTARKVLYATVLVLVALGLCEGAVRLRAWLRYGSAATGVRDPLLTYDPAINLYSPTPGYEVQGARIHVKINSLGFRGDEFSRGKPPDTYRIAVLGASTSFNAEVSSNHATWPHRLQERLRTAHHGVNIEVINAAVAGYVADDNLKNLRHRVLPLDPDLVIYYEANNEIVRDTRELALREGLIDAADSSAFVAAASRYSLLFDLVQKNITIMRRGAGGATGRLDAIPADLPRRFLTVLDDIRGELAAREVPFVLSTFVVKYRRAQDRATQTANADVAFYYMPWMSIDGLLHAMDTYNAAIVEYGRRHDLRVVDDRERIPADAEHFADCMHLTDRGAEAMADRFFTYFEHERLVDQLVARRRPRGIP